MVNGKVYLIPTIISEDTQSAVISAGVKEVLPNLKYFLVENIRTARRYLSSLKIFESIEPLHFEVLDKETTKDVMLELFAPLFAGDSIGILSESGCPGIADPGALAVQFAHEKNIVVVPLVGPSSILLALISSGLNGQRFAFHGYLPVGQKQLTQVIKDLERESRTKNQTQLFIETPYRNNNMMKVLVEVLNPATLLTVAIDITGTNEYIKTMRVSEWKKTKPVFPKLPAIFLFLAI
jgi:16S rRNA (cytidine1402-2'-O)-methyltransferase